MVYNDSTQRGGGGVTVNAVVPVCGRAGPASGVRVRPTDVTASHTPGLPVVRRRVRLDR